MKLRISVGSYDPKKDLIGYTLSLPEEGISESYWAKCNLPPHMQVNMDETFTRAALVFPVVGALVDPIASLRPAGGKLEIEFEPALSLPKAAINFIFYCWTFYRKALLEYHCIKDDLTDFSIIGLIPIKMPKKKPTHDRLVGMFSGGTDALLSRILMSTICTNGFDHMYVYFQRNTFATIRSRHDQCVHRLGHTYKVETNLSNFARVMERTLGDEMHGYAGCRAYRTLEIIPVVLMAGAEYLTMANEMGANMVFLGKPDGNMKHTVYPYHGWWTETLMHSAYLTGVMSSFYGEDNTESVIAFSPLSMLSELTVARIMAKEYPKIIEEASTSCYFTTEKRKWCGKCEKCGKVYRAFREEGKKAKFIPIHREGIIKGDEMDDTGNWTYVGNLPWIPARFRQPILDFCLKHAYPTSMLPNTCLGSRYGT